ncbi:ATP-binding protein [Hyphomicrobium sp.]|jgi:two-component system osmolarity sensor histidine kinase EnvZ|uniref:ATP-binding protein n=1 Tax=Hyphomicrobium sp. TaxID=82 RepID=UPI002C0CBB37|nr:ATP-binding protein [Hyphomicrobium sp.]HVZ03540.1 ATP-binding protein [Hyphomicrobium sp.]
MAVINETTPEADSGRSRYRRFREHPLVVRLLGIASDMLPKGLYARALLIIITPIVVLEGVIAFAFMERHWQAVTRRLSEATARDIAALIEVYSDRPKSESAQKIVDLARDRLNLKMEVLPPGDLPPPGPKPFFRLLDRALSNELRKHVQLPFWIDTVGESQNVEIRVKRPEAILRFVATRSQTYASNSHIFLLWMVGSSVILLTVAILFLRNQIRPILRLADAADAFGKGRSIPQDFRPRGAREVRQAAVAFLQMRDRIKQHVEQRTTMLAGVSHDLRTVLTRFKLELALLEDSPEARALSGDVDEMQHMLEDYLAFAKGDGGEEAEPTDLPALLQEIVDDAAIYETTIDLKIRKSKGNIVLPLKRQALKRAITNLVTNATRFGDHIIIRVAREGHWVRIEVDDNGPGIPEKERENVFRPFYRLDHARNQDDGNSGLGLAIARDIAKSHGGEIALGESSMGGLRAIISLPQ